MPAWLNKLLIPFQRKTDPAYPIYSQIMGIGTPIYTPKEYKSIAKSSFEKNITCYRAISLIAESCAGIPWKLYRQKNKKREITSHPLLDLLAQPNPDHSFFEFLEEVVSFWLIAGNSYVVAVRPNNRALPQELWTLRPDRMRVIPGMKAISGYEYMMDAIKTNFAKPDILHLKMFSSTDDWYGLSPILVAMDLVDQQNEGNDWNIALLQNAGRPSGALVAAGTLGGDQYERLRKVVRERYIGKHNAGMPLLLEGGLDWKAFSMSPMELDWLESRRQNQRDISVALGVPPELLGDSANKTYCLPKETLVATPAGMRTIDDIFVGDEVYSLDVQYTMVTRKVTFAARIGKRQLYKITTPHQMVKATGNHPFLLYNSANNTYFYRNAEDLRIGDLPVIAYLYPHLIADSCTAMTYTRDMRLPEFCETQPVIAIEFAGIEDVYDLEIEENHNFFANHFCVHNSNYGEARKSFYQETVLPLMDRLRDSFNAWLTAQYDPAMYLDYDKEEIEALQEDRDSLSTRLSMQWQNGIITLNEIRKGLGLDELVGGDILQLKATGVFYIPTAQLDEVVSQKLENLLAPPIPQPALPGAPTQTPDTVNPTSDTEGASTNVGQESSETEKDTMGTDRIEAKQYLEQCLHSYIGQESERIGRVARSASLPESIAPRVKRAIQTAHFFPLQEGIYHFFEGGEKKDLQDYAIARTTSFREQFEQMMLSEMEDAISYGLVKQESVEQIANHLQTLYKIVAEQQVKAWVDMEYQAAQNYAKALVERKNEELPRDPDLVMRQVDALLASLDGKHYRRKPSKKPVVIVEEVKEESSLDEKKEAIPMAISTPEQKLEETSVKIPQEVSSEIQDEGNKDEEVLSSEPGNLETKSDRRAAYRAFMTNFEEQ